MFGWGSSMIIACLDLGIPFRKAEDPYRSSKPERCSFSMTILCEGYASQSLVKVAKMGLSKNQQLSGPPGLGRDCSREATISEIPCQVQYIQL